MILTVNIPKREQKVTNGDILMTIFPNVQTREVCNGELVEFTLDGVVGISVTKEWWSAPYKTESEDKE